MFGHLLRVTGTVLVIAVACVTPVLTMSAPASADTVINGCTIVSNPTATNFTNCPGTNFTGANLSGLDLSFANLSGSVFVQCVSGPLVGSCTSTDLSTANLTQANLTGIVAFASTFSKGAAFAGADFSGANLSGANMSNTDYAGANFSDANLTNANLTDAAFFTQNSVPPQQVSATLTGANLTGATFTGADFTGTVLIPSDQTRGATGSAVVTWTTSSLPGATPGPCTPASGSTFPQGSTTVTCQVLDDQGDVATGTFQVDVGTGPSTSVLIPSNGATVTGDSWLDAAASGGPAPLLGVQFELTGGTLSNQVIATVTTPTLYGWIGAWNSTSVPNGTYSLQSVAVDSSLGFTPGNPITITVNNPPPSTFVTVPSNGSTQSGTTAVLDAGATADVTSLSYELTGGTLTNQVIATGTATFYGWLAVWNTTSIPNGTYTLQSVGTYSGGTVTSAPITITVSN